MAVEIDRIAIVDDDGSGEAGTIADAAFMEQFYDDIDAALAALEALIPEGSDPSVVTTTSTGTQNDFAVAAGTTVLRCNNASELVLTGIALSGVVDGQILDIVNIGSSTVRVAHQNTGSTAANRVIGQSTRGQIVGANGSIRLVYDGTTQRWRITQVEPGAWITVAHDGGNFTGLTSMTWTVESGDQSAYSYRQEGSTLTVVLVVNTSSVGGTLSSALLATLPNSFTAKIAATDALGRLSDAGSGTTGFVQVLQSGSQLRIFRTNEANFSSATNTTSVQLVFTFEVN
jgi:hypothetical protein